MAILGIYLKFRVNMVNIKVTRKKLAKIELYKIAKVLMVAS